MRRIVFFLALWSPLAGPAASGELSAELFQAARNGDVPFLKAHLTKDAIESRDRRGATLLMHAAAFGNVEILEILLDAGVDVNAQNAFNATALLWGARDAGKARL